MIIGGLHGREWRIIRPILQRVKPRDIKGTIILAPRISFQKKYISTLNPKYYELPMGKRLLSLLRAYKPDIYLEIHGYSQKSLPKLTDPSRIEKYGAPPFYKLNNNILIGCVSPLLLRRIFISASFAVEVPLKLDDEALNYAGYLLRLLMESQDKEDIWRRIAGLDDSIEYRDYMRRIRTWIYKIGKL
jgi:hypothetical protein